MRLWLAFGCLASLAACAGTLPVQEVDVVKVAAQCEARARAAKAPTGTASFGLNSKSGPSTALSIGFSSDYLSGRDPVQVYESCVYERTGESPYRPPVLD